MTLSGSTERAGDPLLSASSIAKSFGGLRALVDCSLDVKRNSITGLVGPNGSGKTTLFNVITGYQRPDAGQIRLDGREITGSTPDKVFAAGIGRTFQLTRVFRRITVLENMLVATQHDEGWLRSMTRSKSSPADVDNAMEWLEFVGIARLAELEAGFHRP